MGQRRRPAGRRHRLVRLLLVLAGLAGVVSVAAVTAANLVAHHYLSSVHRLSDPFAALPPASRPAPAKGGMTLLLAGLDNREQPGGAAQPGTVLDARSDTLMVVRI